MEVERHVKAQPGGETEASWSSGPRTTIRIPDFTDEELRSLASQRRVGAELPGMELDQAFSSAGLAEISESIDRLIGKLPNPPVKGPGADQGPSGGTAARGGLLSGVRELFRNRGDR